MSKHPTPMESLRAYLATMLAARRMCGEPPRGYAYFGVEDLLLRHGLAFEPGPLPKGVKAAPLGACFKNSFDLAFKRKDMTYCEGYAAGAIPVLHAWCVDAHGRVVDPTWCQGFGGRDLMGEAYFGLPFDTPDLIRLTVQRGSYGLLEDWENHYPLLRDPWVAGERARSLAGVLAGAGQ